MGNLVGHDTAAGATARKVVLALLAVGITVGAWMSVKALTGDEPAEQVATPRSSATSAPGSEQIVVPPTAARAALQRGALPLDVRTPEEFAAGHLAGARNIDVNSPDFDATVAKLAPAATYVVYCASGNRSGQAIGRMSALGFTKLINGGGYEDLAAAGLTTAKG